MKIWLITVGEPLPTDEGDNHLHRTGNLANILVARGHSVDWWTSTFDHFGKKQRGNSSCVVEVSDRFRIRELYGPSYTRNISARRIINHVAVAREFVRLCEDFPAPDIILCSMPTIELSKAAVAYGSKRGIPVILDMRDMWPDIFVDAVLAPLRPVAKTVISPMARQLRSACAGASAIWGITPEFVDWGLRYAGRKRSSADAHFWLGFSEKSPPKEALEAAELEWKRLGIHRGDGQFTVCYVGAISNKLDLDPVLKAARELESQSRSFRFVICGNGDFLEKYRVEARGSKNILFPGWVNGPSMWTLMRLSSAALAPLHSRQDFIMSIPNKIIQYLSAGLPVVSCLQGSLARLLESRNAGLTYPNGNAVSLMNHLIRLHDNAALRDTMSQNAQAAFRSEFVAEKVFGEMASRLEAFGG